MNVMRKKWLRLALPVLAAGALSAACGDDEEDGDMMGVTIDDLVGTWDASSVELTSPLLGGTVDLVGTLGATVTLTIQSDGTFSFTATQTAITPPLSLTGEIEITGDNSATVLTDPVEPGDVPVPATFNLAGDNLSIDIPDASLGLDLNMDGTVDEADDVDLTAAFTRS